MILLHRQFSNTITTSLPRNTTAGCLWTPGCSALKARLCRLSSAKSDDSPAAIDRGGSQGTRKLLDVLVDLQAYGVLCQPLLDPLVESLGLLGQLHQVI